MFSSLSSWWFGEASSSVAAEDPKVNKIEQLRGEIATLRANGKMNKKSCRILVRKYFELRKLLKEKGDVLGAEQVLREASEWLADGALRLLDDERFAEQIELKMTTLFRARPDLAWVASAYERCFSRTLATKYRGQLFADVLRQAKTHPTHITLFGPLQLDLGKDMRVCYGAEHKTVAELLADVRTWMPSNLIEPTSSSSAATPTPIIDRYHFKSAPATSEGVPVWIVQRIDPYALIVV